MDHRTRQLTASTKLVTRLMLIVLLSGAALLAVTRESHACSYVPPGSPSEELRKSIRVFAGRIVASHPVSNDKIYEFKVHTVWKGPLRETTYVRGQEYAYGDTSCSGSYKPFVVGVDYLVYDAYHVASRTGPLVNASEDIAELGEGRRPVIGSRALVPAELFRARAATDEARALEERASRAQATRTLVVVGAVTFLVVISIGGLLIRRRGLFRR